MHRLTALIDYSHSKFYLQMITHSLTATKTDVLLKAKNSVDKTSVAVIELKLLVGEDITAGESDSLVQLFYEGYLVCMEEGTHYEELLCIFANHHNWHFFVMDMSKVIKTCKFYCSGSKLSPQNVYTRLYIKN